MKKTIIALCTVLLFVFSQAGASFAEVTETDSGKISSETEQFLYGGWKVKAFLGFQMITKDDIEYPNGENILGKDVTIAQNLFSTSDFAPEYEKYAVNIQNCEYKIIESLTGEEFTLNYRVSEDVTKIKDTDKVQVIEPVSEDKNYTSAGPMMVIVNNQRLLMSINCDYFELGKNIWSANDMDVAIYTPDVYNDGFYHINYHNNEAELIPQDDHIRLLMINGGFVPYPDIKVENGRTLVPIRIISEILGAKVEWDESKNTIEISDGKSKISLTVNSTDASTNGKIIKLDVPPEIINGKAYVPVRFIAEAMDTDVGYVSNISASGTQKFGSNAEKTVSQVSVITIESKENGTKGYSVDDGLKKVKEVSAEEYQSLVGYFKECGRSFDKFDKDYDYKDIVFKNQTYGRYYVYKLAAFPQFNIFFNKYTGEVYSENAGLPISNISKGFINISWLYQ